MGSFRGPGSAALGANKWPWSELRASQRSTPCIVSQSDSCSKASPVGMPGHHPVELAGAVVGAVAARISSRMSARVRRRIGRFTPTECRTHRRHCGYPATKIPWSAVVSATRSRNCHAPAGPPPAPPGAADRVGLSGRVRAKWTRSAWSRAARHRLPRPARPYWYCLRRIAVVAATAACAKTSRSAGASFS
jgi:hypothetical protein